MLNDNENGLNCLSQLKGNIKVIFGNHCTDNRIKLYNQQSNIEVLGFGYRFKYKKYSFFLSHYPTLTANMDDGESLHQKVISLCGHSHTQDKFCDMNKGLIYHCELDAHNNFPVLIDNIIEDLKKYIQN